MNVQQDHRMGITPQWVAAAVLFRAGFVGLEEFGRVTQECVATAPGAIDVLFPVMAALDDQDKLRREVADSAERVLESIDAPVTTGSDAWLTIWALTRSVDDAALRARQLRSWGIARMSGEPDHLRRLLNDVAVIADDLDDEVDGAIAAAPIELSRLARLAAGQLGMLASPKFIALLGLEA